MTKWLLGRQWLLGAAGSAALAALSSATAWSADLNYYDPPQKYGSAYDDPRYADLYGRSPPPPPAPPIPEKRYYGEGYGRDYGRVPIPREPVYRDYDERPPYEGRYAEAPPRQRIYGARPGCAPKDEVRYRLEQEGWTGFHDAQIANDNTAYVKARRQNGRLFALTVDRCSGDIIAARPLEPRGLPYADRRFDRNYY